MPEYTLLPTPFQAALRNYVHVEAPPKLCTKLVTKFVSCFLSARWQRLQNVTTGLCCADCDDRRTRRIGRCQLKTLEKQVVGLGWDSNCTYLWNGSFHDVLFLCTKSLIIFLLQQDYPTYCKSVIQYLYRNTATERTVNQNFRSFILFSKSFWSRCAVCVEMG